MHIGTSCVLRVSAATSQTPLPTGFYLDRALLQGLCDLAKKLGRSPAIAKSVELASANSIAKDAVTSRARSGRRLPSSANSRMSGEVHDHRLLDSTATMSGSAAARQLAGVEACDMQVSSFILPYHEQQFCTVLKLELPLAIYEDTPHIFIRA